MARTQDNKIGNDATQTAESGSRFIASNPTGQAGSENSLGAESVRDGRPTTGDDVVEAIDEEGPGITAPLAEAEAVPSTASRP
jgi:hypothetical protein